MEYCNNSAIKMFLKTVYILFYQKVMRKEKLNAHFNVTESLTTLGFVFKLYELDMYRTRSNRFEVLRHLISYLFKFSFCLFFYRFGSKSFSSIILFTLILNLKYVSESLEICEQRGLQNGEISEENKVTIEIEQGNRQ